MNAVKAIHEIDDPPLWARIRIVNCPIGIRVFRVRFILKRDQLREISHEQPSSIKGLAARCQNRHLSRKIIAENPPWLAEHGNEPAQQELFLRTKVVVNVYDRYRLKFLNEVEAICITVTSDRQSPQKE